jgi:hypothetical protein
MSKEGSRRESQTRKLQHKTRREELSTEKSHESDNKQQSVLTKCINFIKRNPIAVIALCISIAALTTTWVHYAQLTKPHVELQDATTKLSLLEKQLDLLGIYVDSQDVSQRAADGKEVINQAENLRNEALSAIITDDIPRSLTLITEASQVINGYLSDEANIEPGTVSITAAPFDGWVSIDISQNTTAESEDGLPVNRITIVADGAPPDAYKDYVGILAFEIFPTGTIFSSPITLRFSYLVSNIPEGVAEEDLILGTWDAKTSRWTILPSHVDLETHTISISISHLTLFAVLAPRPN